MLRSETLKRTVESGLPGLVPAQVSRYMCQTQRDSRKEDVTARYLPRLLWSASLRVWFPHYAWAQFTIRKFNIGGPAT